ncbi:polyprenol phosphomannose-dependent alpha 1,6 mannosyltransferase MptB [Sinomonas sp. ASV322]|uniref:polyprenol phosphomannose-dependent alpha 1,6 mannosyltransferase MptB n=1 Tax=Sinomonas sp. ASV322 TaxID=3041920 RepID=UPI0027DE6359|nr:polyprenol phosphomannose-dependent alpha 1,6 mannosyltransferase MptB [Sinomonas sp. ASV322]MDQ4502304.1 polyprenol phosphomannose-dependent alpha 1,6 mannosyltransferase MptB [Sinomonas sp. ASV322]
MSATRFGLLGRVLEWLRSLWTALPPVGVNQPSHWALGQGFVGSLLMVYGSFGVGRLADVSPLTRSPFFIALRTESWGVTSCILALVVGAMLLTRSWLRLGQRLRYWGSGTVRPVAVAIVLWGLPLAFTVPIYSRDVYAYVGQGRLMAAGLNPYTTGISALNNWLELGTDPSWASTRTPYGPYFLWLERWVVQLTGGQPDTSVLLFRVLALAGVALCAFYGFKLARLHGVDGARAVWLTVANPLFLISCIASAHNEALMIGFAVAGVYYAARGNWFLGIVLATASIGIKPITAVVLPFVGLLWAGPRATWLRKFLCWAATGLVSLGLFAASSLVYGLGFGWVNAIVDPTPGFIAYTPSGFASNVIAWLGSTVGLDGGSIAEVFRTVLKWIGVGLAVLLILRGDNNKVVRRLGLAFMFIVVLGPIIQPWYVLWFIPFLAVTGIRDNWEIRLWYLTVVFFVVFGAQDQLYVFGFVNTPLAPEAIAGITAVAFLAYLVLIDPKTRRIVFERPAGRQNLAARSS